MPTDDLNSIPGLADKHIRVLARQQITDVRTFAAADQHAVYQAMAKLRPRPSLEQVSQWQAAASGLAAAPPEAGQGLAPADPGWQTVASFAIIFTQRQAGRTWERRVEAERTEVEPEQEPGKWTGWDPASVAAWMASQLPPAPERTRLAIEMVTVMAANQTLDLKSGEAVTSDLAADLTAPVRVAFTVTGAGPGTPLQAVTRVLRPGTPGWNPQPPVALQGPGRAEFDLGDISAGQYELSLLAWAADATARPVSVRLPALIIREP